MSDIPLDIYPWLGDDNDLSNIAGGNFEDTLHYDYEADDPDSIQIDLFGDSSGLDQLSNLHYSDSDIINRTNKTFNDNSNSLNKSAGKFARAGSSKIPSNQENCTRQKRKLMNASCREYDQDDVDSGNLCMSKNAVLARENRQKKKQLIDSMQSSIKRLTKENNDLKKHCRVLEKTADELESEVRYLRSVIHNESTLGQMLKNIPTAKRNTGKHTFSLVPVKSGDDSSSQSRSKRPRWCDTNSRVSETSSQNFSAIDHDYVSTACLKDTVSRRRRCAVRDESSDATDLDKPTEEDHKDAGVCLHVSNNVVTLEFCAKCSNSAQSTVRRE